MLLPGLAPLNDPINRYLLFFTPSVGAVRLVATVGLGLLLWVVYQPLKKLPATGLALLLIFSGVLVIIAISWRINVMAFEVRFRYYSKFVLSLLIPLLGLGAVSVYKHWHITRWTRWLGKATVFVSPILPIFWISVMTSHSYTPVAAPTKAEAGAVKPVPGVPAPTDNVYILVLDAWSYQMSFKDRNVRMRLPALRQASSQMTVFHDAHSPGCVTMTSMTRLLFQRTDTFTFKGGVPGFWDGKQFTACRKLNSIFVEPRMRGYRTYLLGWFHSYPDLVGSQVDLVWSERGTDWLGTRMTDQLRQFCYEGAYNLFGHQKINKIYSHSPDPGNVGLVYSTGKLLGRLNAVIDDPGQGQFVFLHLPLPHYPYIFDRNGPRPMNLQIRKDSIGEAREQLIYTDGVLGALFARLRKAGKYDRSTIVLTSDHTWRRNPDVPYGKGGVWSHVPLLVKYPGQRTRLDIRAPFSTSRLMRLLATARKPGDIAATIKRGDYFVPVPDSEATWRGVRPTVR